MNENIERAIGHMQGTLEAIKESQERVENKLDKHDKRISVVEGFKVQVIALGSGAGALVSAIWSVIKFKLGS